MIQRLQQHTVDIYHLNQKKYTYKRVKARSLLSADRFDLFAKLFYIRLREKDFDRAVKIYTDHILAFNPDGKEPGREDKNGVVDFIRAFDGLIAHFRDKDFDESISLIPVDKNGNPLDGSHRIAALAYYDKEVSILQFEEVKAKAVFDFAYFQKRGLPAHTADAIALESLRYISGLHIACLWPKMGSKNKKAFALKHLRENYAVFYEKLFQINLEGLSKLIYETYKHQDWVGNVENNFAGARSKALSCYAGNGQIYFILFQVSDLKKVEESKESIRTHYHSEEVLHISKDDNETTSIAKLIFTNRKKQLQNRCSEMRDKVREYNSLFKNVYWLNFKVCIAKILKRK
jgi:hypothetical protein